MRKTIVYVFAVFLAASLLRVGVHWEDFYNYEFERWCWVVSQTVASCLAVSALPLLLGSFAKCLIACCLWYILLIVFVEAIARLRFRVGLGGTGTEWAAVLYNSSVSEIEEFLLGFLNWESLSLAFLFLIVLILLARYVVKSECSRTSVSKMLLFLALVVPMVVLDAPPHPYEDQFLKALVDNDLIPSPRVEVFKKYAEIGSAKPGVGDYSIEDKGMRPFGLLVIGESATRDHWQLYGYGRNTTPCLCARQNELVVFQKVKSRSWLTTPAVTDIVSGGYVMSLPGVLNAVGVNSAFASGQGHWGPVDGVDSLLFCQCEEKFYLADVNRGGAYYDGDIVPVFARMNRDSNVGFCFVHLLGSHFDYSRRYPMDFNPHLGQDEGCIGRTVVAYDKSIAYTDRVLDQLISVVQEEHPISFVVYVSDHGETPEQGTRNAGSQSLFRVPLVVWTSSEYRLLNADILSDLKTLADEELTNERTFEIVLRLMRIRCNGQQDSRCGIGR